MCRPYEASACRSCGQLGVKVLRVASVPASHVYVRHLAEPAGVDAVRRLSDPVPRDGRKVPGGWWPPLMLEPGWVTENRDRTARIPSASDNLRSGTPSLPARPSVVALRSRRRRRGPVRDFPVGCGTLVRGELHGDAVQYMRRDVPIAGRPQPFRDRDNPDDCVYSMLPQRTVNRPGGGQRRRQSSHRVIGGVRDGPERRQPPGHAKTSSRGDK